MFDGLGDEILAGGGRAGEHGAGTPPGRYCAAVHSDSGSQFRSRRFVKALRHHGLNGSMGRVGACADKAAMEPFFSPLKKNVLDRRRWLTRQDLRLAITTWIERTYHCRRRLENSRPSNTGSRSPRPKTPSQQKPGHSGPGSPLAKPTRSALPATSPSAFTKPDCCSRGRNIRRPGGQKKSAQPPTRFPSQPVTTRTVASANDRCIRSCRTVAVKFRRRP